MTSAQSLHMPRMAFIRAAAVLFLPGMKMTGAPRPRREEMSDMQLRRCTSRDCRRPYRISQLAGRMSKQSAGRLCCPHCGHVEALWEDDRFSLQPLTEEQEAIYELRRFSGFFSARIGSR